MIGSKVTAILITKCAYRGSLQGETLHLTHKKNVEKRIGFTICRRREIHNMQIKKKIDIY